MTALNGRKNGAHQPPVVACQGFCEPGVASCPTPGFCGAPRPDVGPPDRPIDNEAWLREFAKVRSEMLQMLRMLAPKPDHGYKVDAAKWHARLMISHKLLLDLRPFANDELRLRIDQELSRE